ncbi:vWA domain-containing protein [Hyphomicrobium sulfonivorans]|uniref:vWA domain-containing protein n=1 Tax=Hyphomicrobium sulfonivorans TaxID=121290 RepID=UPI00156E8961|nr:vWA domain-containing protein [Hyphomicrobium sulfonivorans]MBI1651348.1 VWA domain-containing protein [Hyphomicrobium sulfonivorans]NSL72799.1 hypothetical protein [Hyphomicrobium sulfonivorans]
MLLLNRPLTSLCAAAVIATGVISAIAGLGSASARAQEAAAVAATGTPAAAPTAMIIVDGSGSMWGHLGDEKRSKLEIVRDALRTLVPELRAQASVGLAAFGHRRRGNCGDAEIVLPPGNNAARNLSAAVDRMNAVGKGPVALALRESANAIAGAKPASIVLVADDIDNCGQDICSATENLLRANPGLVIHTVTLGLSAAKIAHMSCVPRLTGGQMWNATDTGTVSSALTQAMRLAKLIPDPQAEEPAPLAHADDAAQPDTPAAPARPAGVYLTASLGASAAPLNVPVRWRIRHADAGGEIVKEVAAPSLIEKLAPGTYEIEAQLGLASARQTVTFTGDAAVDARFDLNAGVLKMQARPSAAGAPLAYPIFTVTPANAPAGTPPVWLGREAGPEIVVPAGEYNVTAQSGAVQQQNTVTVTAAAGSGFTPVLTAGRLELSATGGTGATQGEPLTEGVTFILHRDDPDAPQGRREVLRSAAAKPTFMLPAGTYHVTAKTAMAEARTQVAVGAGDVVRHTLPLALTRVTLAAAHSGEATGTALGQITYRVIRLGSDAAEIARTIDAEPQFDLSAGRYRFEATVADSNVIAATELTLGAGQEQRVLLPLQSGSVTLKRADARNVPGSMFWEIQDEKQRTVLRSSDPEPTAVLAPGHYVVRADTADRPLLSTVEIKANEHRTFDFTDQ